MSALVRTLHERAELQPDQLAFDFSSAGHVTDRLTYGELDVAARAVGSFLRARRAPGEPVLLVHPPGLDFIVDFFGCMYAGVVAVPAPAPSNARDLRRFAAIIDKVGARLALTTAAGAASLDRRFTPERDFAGVSVVVVARSVSAEYPASVPGDDADAVLQFTSGSTSQPRGAILTHGNVIANLRQIRDAFDLRTGDCGEAIALWLPQFHDMGLFARLSSVYAGCPCHLIPPFDFARRPFRWLELVSARRATVTGGPNFAFDLCVDRISSEERESFDLSMLRVAFCGAEPVRARTLERFAEAFAPSGFRANALLPCYGLAEATLLVAGRDPGSGVRVLDGDPAVAGTACPPSSVRSSLVSCGRVRDGFDLAIVDAASRARVPDGAAGEIWLRGSSVARGYFADAAATHETFAGHIAGDDGERRYLRTGDVGFVEGGELFVVGREKAMIVVRGRNVFLQDVEDDAVAVHPVLRKAVAFAEPELDGSVIVLCEIAREHARWAQAFGDVIDLVWTTVLANFGCSPSEIALVESGSIVETSSGKVSRDACRDAWQAGGMRVFAHRGAGPVESVPRADAPADELEANLARLVRDVTGIDSIGRNQSLYELGCDSIVVAQIVRRIEDRYRLALDTEPAYGEPTIALLARLVDEHLVRAVEAMTDEQAAVLLGGPERAG